MNFTDRIKQYREDTLSPQRLYRSAVPHFSMAASAETIGLFMAVIMEARPRRLIEHGSGLTSWIFKIWETQDLGELVQFESNTEWSAVMHDFLWQQGFDFQPRKLFREDFMEPFALFLDGPRHEREQIAQMAQPHSRHGIVLFDDANRETVRDIASTYAGGPGTLLDTEPLTTDEYGRYAYLWVGDHFIDTLAVLWEESNIEEATWL